MAERAGGAAPFPGEADGVWDPGTWASFPASVQTLTAPPVWVRTVPACGEVHLWTLHMVNGRVRALTLQVL